MFDGNSEVRTVEVQTNSSRINEPTITSQRAIINILQKKFLSNGRDFSDWEVANILISTQQSFITFFAGLPGVGKTSLARLLAEVQNINSRLQEISVARGWTSQKDLIGFYNPLTSQFQPSNTGLFHFLEALNREQSTKLSAMAYILLDEANLSPVEHYWSCFMGMTDGAKRNALAFGNRKIAIPENLRFLATINYDGTTEPLSPRVVDRAPIIVLPPHTDLNITALSVDENCSDEIQLPLSAEMMDDLFGLSIEIPTFDPSEQNVFDKVRNILLHTNESEGRAVSISPRKEIAVRQYCDKARGIMNAESNLLALDMAILQYILPLVRGNGQKFATRLNRLQDELNKEGLIKSAEFVERMIIVGAEDLHTYDFFCW